MRQHHEAINPATQTPAWALIHMGVNGVAFVVASSRAVSGDVAELGPSVDDLGLPCPLHPGFWLWEGLAWYDGLDGTGLSSEQPLQLLSYRGAACRMALHENL